MGLLSRLKLALRQRRDKNPAALSAALRLFVRVLIIAFIIGSSFSFILDKAGEAAAADASYILNRQLTGIIWDIMQAEGLESGDFLSFEKDEAGAVTAVSCNMAQVNSLSSRILDTLSSITEEKGIRLYIPAGNLSPLGLFSGRGPEIPVEVYILSSSPAFFADTVPVSGSGETQYRLRLSADMDIRLIMPWGRENAELNTELTIADALIMGSAARG